MDTTDPVPGSRAVRCSHHERLLCAATIYQAARQGRLSAGETETRLGRVHTCVRRDELDDLIVDLPDPGEMYDGWRRIAGLARRQLRHDLRVAAGRAPAARQVRIEAWIVLTVLTAAVAVGLVLAAYGLTPTRP